LKAKHIYCGEWELSKSEQKQFSRIMGMEEGTTGGRLNWIICGKFLEENKSIRHPIISAMKRVSEIDLEGQFRYIVPKSIYGYWNRLLSPVLRI
jgi:hypothetical protein